MVLALRCGERAPGAVGSLLITPQWLSQQMPDLSGLTPLGEGGQKWVFAGRHTQDGDVVIKLIKPSGDIERTRREILAVRQISSPRVPAVLDVGMLHSPWGDIIWLRERRVSGESVREIIRARGPLPKEGVLCLGLCMLEALVDAARVRIVHRDVKPENIMRSNDGSYWLLDFGIARHLDLSSLTPSAALGGPGTLGYAPPEQFRNKKRDLDGRADLFALAVTLVECISGRHPYRDGARDAPEVVRRIEGSPLVVPRIAWDPERRFSELVSSMGQRRVDCRPQDARQALEWMRELHSVFGL